MKVLLMGKTSHLTNWHLMLREFPQIRDLAFIEFFPKQRDEGVLCNPNLLRDFYYLIFCGCVVERGVGSWPNSNRMLTLFSSQILNIEICLLAFIQVTIGLLKNSLKGLKSLDFLKSSYKFPKVLGLGGLTCVERKTK